MSDKARKLIKQAIRLHSTEDGASLYGAYRDVIIEVLHFAREASPTIYNSTLYQQICEEGYNAYLEELELVELNKLNKITDKDLPLHSIREFEFDSIKRLFEIRLKGEKQHGKKLHDMRKTNRKENKAT